ncbi:MAG TPA: hypothetical protein VGJ94_18330 [Syntrophorhabdaceae bacterium]|jgi:hypothetical protein
MPTCIKCGSPAAYWTIINKENDLSEYCDTCFKKDDLAKYKKEMDEFQRRRQEDKTRG